MPKIRPWNDYDWKTTDFENHFQKNLQNTPKKDNRRQIWLWKSLKFVKFYKNHDESDNGLVIAARP